VDAAVSFAFEVAQEGFADVRTGELFHS